MAIAARLNAAAITKVTANNVVHINMASCWRASAREVWRSQRAISGFVPKFLAAAEIFSPNDFPRQTSDLRQFGGHGRKAA
jgi:hypothetical protein